MSYSIPIDKLADEIATAASECYVDLTTAFADATIYGFALYTVDDLVGIVPSASSEHGFATRRDKLLADNKQLAWLAEHDIEVERCNLGDNRWSVYEWEYACHGAQLFESANRMLESVLADAEAANLPDSFAVVTGEVMAAFTIALHHLRTASVFDTNKQPITLFCSKPSSYDTGWLERESARRLNPPALYDRFARERIDWIKEDTDDDCPALAVYLDALKDQL